MDEGRRDLSHGAKDPMNPLVTAICKQTVLKCLGFMKAPFGGFQEQLLLRFLEM